MTSLGSCLSSDDMIVSKHEEGEETKHQLSIATTDVRKRGMGSEF